MVNSSGISFSGLGSGLDTGAIIQQLVALERIPIQILEVKKNQHQQKLDKIDELSTKVKALQDAAEKVSTFDEFYAWTVDNSDPTIATISASGGAQAGSHTLEVLKLAQNDRWAFDGVSDPNADLATADGQQVTFEVGTTQYSLTVSAAGSSLNEIAGDINDMAGDDVHATVINTGTTSNPSYRLVLASKEAGEDNRLANIATNITGLSINYTAPDANGDPTSDSNLTVGSNSQAIVDGLLIERTTNDLSNVFEGIEIDILSTNVGSPITFSVGADKEAVRENVDSFLTAYNDVIEFINQQSTFTPAEDEGESGTSGELFGDTILTSVRSSINRALFNVDPDVVSNDTAGFSTLSLVGITQESDGKLSLDQAKFDEKVAEDLSALADLFVDSDGFDNGGAQANTPEYFVDTTADSGLAANLVREIDRMFGTIEGTSIDALFDLKKDTIQTAMDSFNDQIDRMEVRLEKYEEGLVLRFARLEELMGALNAQGASLAGALGS